MLMWVGGWWCEVMKKEEMGDGRVPKILIATALLQALIGELYPHKRREIVHRGHRRRHVICGACGTPHSKMLAAKHRTSGVSMAVENEIRVCRTIAMESTVREVIA